jgi:glycosyltransferase involved in cell wall biosynthesis
MKLRETMPNVSIIVTTYNRKDQLREAIQAILNQTYQDFELIIVDNFSNYDFFDFINEFKSEKIVPIQNNNKGIIAINRNVGIQIAKGEYIAFCDDDDVWLQTKLSTQIDILNSNHFELVYCNTILFFESGKEVVTNYKPTNTLNQLLFTNHITTSSVVLKNNGNINFIEDPNFTGIEDYELWLRMKILGYRFHLISDSLVRYRVLITSFSSSSRSKNEKKIIQLKKQLMQRKIKLSFANMVTIQFSLILSYIRLVILLILKR